MGRCDAEGYWTGHLSSSALATATAAFALGQLDPTGAAQDNFIDPALAWLCENQNDNGGWGDTPSSPSNVATTLLVWSALAMKQAQRTEPLRRAQERAAQYLQRRAGGTEPTHLTSTILQCYGKDRTFSVPILTMAALSGRLGQGRSAWRHIQPLPFELAAWPQRLWHKLGLPVVSYAAPALIAIGQARFFHAPPRFLPLRWLRRLAVKPTLRLLERIQPSSGGFLEAAPLTSFVLMSLCSTGRGRHPVAQKAAEFLRFSVRPDGSWPIDTNLSVWLTGLAVRAAGDDLSDTHRCQLTRWLLDRQLRREHPYTLAPAGGWTWTELPGGVPDADDTAGAMVALFELDRESPEVRAAAQRAARWLLNLQNADGGIPTFCRGWGKLPFDRSSPDLTAHALLAWHLWAKRLDAATCWQIQSSTRTAIDYLAHEQGPEGAWSALWFGNQRASDHANLVYGTSRVLLALEHLAGDWPVQEMMRRAVGYLLRAQNSDGGWGGQESLDSSVEESALAAEALAACAAGKELLGAQASAAREAIEEGCRYLLGRTRQGMEFPESPIGLYFAKLWYSEQLYPMLFTLSAWRRALAMLRSPQPAQKGA